jgi:hypothetical protein
MRKPDTEGDPGQLCSELSEDIVMADRRRSGRRRFFGGCGVLLLGAALTPLFDWFVLLCAAGSIMAVLGAYGRCDPAPSNVLPAGGGDVFEGKLGDDLLM